MGHASSRATVDSAEASVAAASQFCPILSPSSLSGVMPSQALANKPPAHKRKDSEIHFTNEESEVRGILLYYFTQPYPANMRWSQNALSKCQGAVKAQQLENRVQGWK